VVARVIHAPAHENHQEAHVSHDDVREAATGCREVNGEAGGVRC